MRRICFFQTNTNSLLVRFINTYYVYQYFYIPHVTTNCLVNEPLRRLISNANVDLNFKFKFLFLVYYYFNTVKSTYILYFITCFPVLFQPYIIINLLRFAGLIKPAITICIDIFEN